MEDAGNIIFASVLVYIGIVIPMVFWFQEISLSLSAPQQMHFHYMSFSYLKFKTMDVQAFMAREGNSCSFIKYLSNGFELLMIENEEGMLVHSENDYSCQQPDILLGNKIYYRGKYHKENCSTVKNINFTGIAINTLLDRRSKNRIFEVGYTLLWMPAFVRQKNRIWI